MFVFFCRSAVSLSRGFTTLLFCDVLLRALFPFPRCITTRRFARVTTFKCYPVFGLRLRLYLILRFFSAPTASRQADCLAPKNWYMSFIVWINQKRRLQSSQSAKLFHVTWRNTMLAEPINGILQLQWRNVSGCIVTKELKVDCFDRNKDTNERIRLRF